MHASVCGVYVQHAGVYLEFPQEDWALSAAASLLQQQSLKSPVEGLQELIALTEALSNGQGSGLGFRV